MSSATPSPVTTGSISEGSAHGRTMSEVGGAAAAMSPRSALLSHTSRHGPPPGPSLTSPTESHRRGSRAIEKRRSHRNSKLTSGERRSRGTSQTPDYNHSALNSPSILDLDRIKKDPKGEAMRLRELLEVAVREIHTQVKRGDDLERANEETALKFRVLNDNRLTAQQEAAKANADLRLYHFQLENAKKEIDRAQDALKEIERQRDDAEDAAQRARAKARRLNHEKLVAAAKEEGRKMGFQAGFDVARREREALDARRAAAAANAIQSAKGKERAYSPRRQPHSHSRHRRPPSVEESDDELSSLDDFPRPLPAYELPPPNHAGPSNSTPLRPFQPPPTNTESHLDSVSDESEPHTERERRPRPPSVRQFDYAHMKTPAVSVWNIDVPPQDLLDRSFNSQENQDVAVATSQPLDQWMTAEKHQEVRGPSPSASASGTATRPRSSSHTHPERPPSQQSRHSTKPPPPAIIIPPPVVPISVATAQKILAKTNALRPPIQPTAPPPVSAAKTVKFPKLSRPSLIKTKQQATSWYRSLSFRKKNKPVIDPIAEAEENAGDEDEQVAETAGPSTGEGGPSTGSSTEPPDTAGPGAGPTSEELFGNAPPPSESWYQKNKHASAPVGVPLSASIKSGRRRPASDAFSVSTKMSQFDLLATPAGGVIESNMSIRAGKERERVKEKESLLSVIKEDPASRGNTPDRYGGAARQSAFGNPLRNQSSYGTLASTTTAPRQSKRQSRRPPEINVPDPDAPLEAAGVAYARHSQLAVPASQAAHGYGAGPSTPRGANGYPVIGAWGANANGYGTAGPSSSATHLDVNPGLNRQMSKNSMRSIAIDVVPPSGFAPDAGIKSPPHTGRNHLSPYHTFQPQALRQSMQSLRSQVNAIVRPDEHTRGDRPVHQRPSLQDILQSPTRPGSSNAGPLQPPRAPFAGYGYPIPARSASGRPESVQSGASRRPPPRMASQSSFVVANPDPNPPSQSSEASPPTQVPSSSRRSVSNQHRQVEGTGNGSANPYVLAPPIHRVPSNTSMKSQNSAYKSFQPDNYTDPAFFEADGSVTPNPNLRPTSANSGLSYV